MDNLSLYLQGQLYSIQLFSPKYDKCFVQIWLMRVELFTSYCTGKYDKPKVTKTTFSMTVYPDAIQRICDHRVCMREVKALLHHR